MSSSRHLISRIVRPIGADRRGAVIIEFAICSAAFMALLIACAQTVMIFFTQQALQTAAESGARYIMTGQASRATMTVAQFRTYACAQMPPLVDCNKLIVDVRTAASFDAIDSGDVSKTVTFDSSGNNNNSWEFSTGATEAIMIVRVMYLWDVRAGPLNLDFSNAGRGKRLLIGTMVFKSEAYKA